MDIAKVVNLLNQIEMASRQIESQDAPSTDHMGQIRALVDEIRYEVAPPPDDPRPRTRDQISEMEWAEYEWHDVTAMGDRQRQYLRGLKR